MSDTSIPAAFRRARSMGFAAAPALNMARQWMADHAAMSAAYRAAKETEEAARVASNEAKSAAAFLARDGGPRYEAAAAAVTEAVAAYDRAERAARAALKAASAARVRCVAPSRDYGPGTWQGGRHAPGMSAGSEGGLFALHDADGQGAVRNVRDAHDVARLDHTGWFTDPHGDVFKDGTGLCLGVVAQLRGRDGRAAFVPGYRFGGHDDSGTFNMRDVYRAEGREEWQAEEAAEEAARAADSMAESAAEEEREYQQAWGAGSAYAAAMETEEAARNEARDVLRERRAARAADPGAYPALCGAIRARVSALLDTIRDAREERAQLAEGESDPYWFSTRDTRLRAAFCEGAGLDRFPA